MGERALRGSRLGAVSYETDEGTEPVARVIMRYDCPNDHHFAVPFAADVEVPNTWECRFCGANATVVNGGMAEPRKLKPVRTHWDMLLERRSVPELEALLEERLTVLRDRGRKSA